MKKYHYLYITENLINKKLYIGVHSTDNIEDGYLGSGMNILRAIKKYGKENFEREIIEFFDSGEEVEEAEKLIVNKYVVDCNLFYNLKEGGCLPPIMIGKDNPMFGKEKNKDTKSKISNSLKIYQSKNGYNKPNLGKNFSEEWKENIGKSLTGKKRPEMSSKVSSPVQHTKLNIFFSSLKEACVVMDINLSTERGRMWRNKSDFKFI